MRGRRPDPDGLQELKGRPAKRGKARSAPPAPASTVPGDSALKPPTKLRSAAQHVWRELAPELERMNFMRSTDRNAFSRYCQATAAFWEITKRLDEEDVVYLTETPHGKMKRANPLFLIQDRLARRLEGLEDRFGLTPAARQQVILRMAQRATELPFGAPPPDKAPEPPNPSPVGILTRPSRLN